MSNAHYHIFGLGNGLNDLHYIGWTPRSVPEEQELIVSELAAHASRDIACWIDQAMRCGQISIFEIESAPSAESAKDSATSWCRYFKSLGLDVTTDAH